MLCIKMCRFLQTCSEMVMPIGRGINDTMFPPAPFDLQDYTKECQKRFGVTPRPHWITTEFGGHVLSFFHTSILTCTFFFPSPNYLILSAFSSSHQQNISFVLKNFASNIIFSNGLRDPYSAAGYVNSFNLATNMKTLYLYMNTNNLSWIFFSVLKSISDSVVALVTEKGRRSLHKLLPIAQSIIFFTYMNMNTILTWSLIRVYHLGAHCLDTMAPSQDDPEWLVEQRHAEIEIIGKWLLQYKADLDKSVQ